MNKKAIIFDLDGTLWDSSETIAKAWESTIKFLYPRKDTPSEEMIKSVLGKTNEYIINNLFSNYPLSEAQILLKKCQDKEIDYIIKYGGKLYENAENVLKNLSKKYKLYIVSNCQNGYIEAFLKFYNFNQYFEDFECYENTGLDKSENIKLIMKRNKIQNAVYVGDTESDLQAAYEANIQFIYSKYGFGNIKQSNYSISQLSELNSIVDMILQN